MKQEASLLQREVVHLLLRKKLINKRRLNNLLFARVFNDQESERMPVQHYKRHVEMLVLFLRSPKLQHKKASPEEKGPGRAGLIIVSILFECRKFRQLIIGHRVKQDRI